MDMPSIDIRRLAPAAFVAIALALAPATLSPTGTVEVEELCASADCAPKAGAFCTEDGRILQDYEPVRGVG